MSNAEIFSIAGRQIGSDCKPYIIAELSGNHNQSIDRALALVDAAADAGADAIKLQTYTAETMTLNSTMPGFVIDNPESLWHGRSLYDLYEEAHTPWEWHQALFERAKEKGITIFSSPFDKTSVDFLETLNVPCYKVASFECIDIPLIRYIASKGKPMIVSTGMATLAEIDDAVRAMREEGCEHFVLLKCTSTYPAKAYNSNIATIPHMKGLFHCEVGLSDHTLGSGAAVAAVALGACVIEKHFTLSRADGGVDSAFSMEPDELKRLVQDTETAHQAMGAIQYGPLSDELGSVQFRRSLYLCQDVKKGDVLTPYNVRAIRPGFGLPPKEIDKVLGCTVTSDLPAGTPLSWSLLK
ncbi:pseudaminic acid synthase [Bacterioplanoides sp.]|uniref:pseudaminic acid synthase n=1 Tax=Bacterioplanoides sp. TaxID=2066072 RepID=UPI003B00CCB1